MVRIKLFKIENNGRYIFASLLLVVAFIIGHFFPAKIISSEKCSGDECFISLEKPELTDKKIRYYVNNAINGGDGKYYRLTFKESNNKKTNLTAKISTLSDKEKNIGTLSLDDDNKENFQEIIFWADPGYPDLLFEKNKEDGAEVSIRDVRVSALNVTSKEELSKLRPTIYGGMNIVPDQRQTENIFSFEQLKTPNLMLGQVFKPTADNIASVSLDMDIIKQGNGGGKKYKLELRKVRLDGDVPDIESDVLAQTEFSLNDASRFIDQEGKFTFPLYSHLKPGKSYFIGINNDNVDVNAHNYLRLKGSPETNKYAQGMMAIKNKGETYSFSGSLFFITYGAKFNDYNGIKVLNGATIEDTGKDGGTYRYLSKGGSADILDLEDSSADVKFNDDNETLVGLIDSHPESFYMYKLETIHPFARFKIKARQADVNYGKTSILYSFDKKEWKQVPSYETADSIEAVVDDKIQLFDYSVDSGALHNFIYLKIVPEQSDSNEKKYGLKEIQVSADLIMR